MAHTVRALPCCLSLLFLVGCQAATEPDQARSSEWLELIQTHARTAVRAQQQLAALQALPRAHDSNPSARQEDQDAMDLDFQGDAEALLRGLASRHGYQLHILGKRPRSAPKVDIRARRQSIHELITEVGLQVAGQAQVSINRPLKRMTLRYKA